MDNQILQDLIYMRCLDCTQKNQWANITNTQTVAKLYK